MPMVTVKLLKDAFTPEQKTALLREVTEAFVRVTSEAIRPNVVAIIEEVADGAWAYGGEPLTLASLRARRAAAQAKHQAPA